MGRIGQICRIGPALILFSAASCSGSLFKVKPPSALPPLAATAAHADLGSISFRAAPLLTDEESQELFESNLHLAGLLPVRVEIIHNSGEAIDLSKVRFHLRDASGTEWKTIPAKQAIGRILKANGVFAYNPNSRKTFEKEFRAYEFNMKEPVTHAEGKRHGLLIFLSAKKEPVSALKNLPLTIEGLAQPVSLKLN